MRRKIVTGRRDQRYFTRTASQTKRVNIEPKIMRGGIRF